MRTIGVAELKARLSEQLAVVKAGEEIVVTERNVPIARLIPFPSLESGERRTELARRGLLKLAARPPRECRPTVEDPGGLLLKALLEEREEGR